jgi:hypothetical protein
MLVVKRVEDLKAGDNILNVGVIESISDHSKEFRGVNVVNDGRNKVRPVNEAYYDVMYNYSAVLFIEI